MHVHSDYLQVARSPGRKPERFSSERRELRAASVSAGQSVPSPEPAPEAVEEMGARRRVIFAHSGGAAELRALQTALDALEAASSATVAAAHLAREQQLMAMQVEHSGGDGGGSGETDGAMMAQQDAEYALAVAHDLQRQAEQEQERAEQEKECAELSVEEVRERRRRHFEQNQPQQRRQQQQHESGELE